MGEITSPAHKLTLSIRSEKPPSRAAFWFFERLTKDDAAIDGHGFKLEREALAVLVRPCGTDLVPV